MARLLAVAQAIPEIHNYLWDYMRSEPEQILDTIRARLDEATFLVEQESGHQMSLDDAIAYALEGTML